MADRLRLPADDPRRRFVRLRNPLSEEQSVMRTLLLGSLLGVAAYNAARDGGDLRLFETGGVYLADVEGALPDEHRHVGVVLTGAARPRSWRTPEPPAADFFAAKGVLTALLDTLRLQWSVAEAPQPFLHPGRSAAVHVEGELLGWLGEVHPLVTRAFDLGRAAAFELDLDRLAEFAGARVETYEDVTSFPSVRQDIAVVVADDVAAERVRQIVREAGGDLLRRAEVFDVYRGEQVGEGRVSLALALEFRAPDRTLTDDEVAELRAAIADALKREAGGELRA
jgi:phenylalanyl-tRNA synthetase beta chain